MKTSPAGIFALTLHEGIVPGPYLDSVGVWTWGIGHTAAAGPPRPVDLPRGMPANLDSALARVFEQFRLDLAKYEAAVNRAVKVPLKQHQFDALVSFHYNTGAIAKAKLIGMLNAGDLAGAARGFMSWVKPLEIKKRREAEMVLFRYGTHPKGKASVWGVTNQGKVLWKPVRTLSMDEVLGLMDVPVASSTPEIRPGAPAPTPPVPAPPNKLKGLLAWLLLLLASIFKRK